MIVADTSVWVDYLRGVRTAHSLLLNDLLGRKRIVVGDLVLCEVLRGIASGKEARRVELLLRECRIMPMVNDILAVEAATNYRVMRAEGAIVRKTVDLLIGTFCLHHGFDLLHRDRDFDAMERYLGLTVLHP